MTSNNNARLKRNGLSLLILFLRLVAKFIDNKIANKPKDFLN